MAPIRPKEGIHDGELCLDVAQAAFDTANIIAPANWLMSTV